MSQQTNTSIKDNCLLHKTNFSHGLNLGCDYCYAALVYRSKNGEDITNDSNSDCSIHGTDLTNGASLGCQGCSVGFTYRCISFVYYRVNIGEQYVFRHQSQPRVVHNQVVHNQVVPIVSNNIKNTISNRSLITDGIQDCIFHGTNLSNGLQMDCRGCLAAMKVRIDNNLNTFK